MRDRILILNTGTMRRHILAFVVAAGMVSIVSSAAGQSTPAAQPPASPPAEAKYTGCVERLATDKDVLVLSGDTVCAKLTGKFTAADLAGHEVELKGVLTARTPGAPASISVGSVVLVGKSCSDTCSLRPPGTRGLGKGGETPGKEGGTPGLAPTPSPPQ